MAKAKPKQLKVTLIKSIIGAQKSQIATANALGLRKVHSSNVVQSDAATLGKIKKLAHVLSVEEVSQ